MKRSYKNIALATVAVSVLIAGCAVGPDFKRPGAPEVKSLTDTPLPAQTAAADVPAGASQKFVDDKDVPAHWWELFASPELNTLVEQALKANPDLEAARAALHAAQEKTSAGYGLLFPTVDFTPGISRQKISPAAFGQPNSPSSIFTLYNASVTVSYGIDLFGGSRRAIEGLEAQTDYARFEMQAAYVTLTANVVTTAIEEASLRQQIKDIEAIADVQQKQLDTFKKQLELGAIAKNIVLSQESLLAQTRTTLPTLQKQLAITRDQLAVLTGHFPGEMPQTSLDLNSLHLPEELPVSLPSKLVEQRPDIKAAEAQLHAASAEVGVTTANMLPQITLSGSYGAESTTFSGLSSGSATVWSVGAGLLQPIFHAGTLLHERRAAEAQYDQALALYRSSVLRAFGNVADSLRALQYDADAVNVQAASAQSANSSLTLAKAQMDAGAISYPQLLDAERTDAQARVGLTQAQAARFADTAALYSALGGDWRTATAPYTPIPAPTPIIAPTAATEKKP